MFYRNRHDINCLVTTILDYTTSDETIVPTINASLVQLRATLENIPDDKSTNALAKYHDSPSKTYFIEHGFKEPPGFKRITKILYYLENNYQVVIPNEIKHNYDLIYKWLDENWADIFPFISDMIIVA